MKPIIIDMKDMSDSTEIYDSKPNRFMVYTIYVILLMFIVTLIWMIVAKIDIVVKSDGIFKGSNALYEVNSAVAGRVEENKILDGQYVNEGDVLYVLEIESLSDTIVNCQNELEVAEDRLEILTAYEQSLSGTKEDLDIYSDNPYYVEFLDRRELLFANIALSESDTNGQSLLYQGNIESISETIEKYNEKINKLNEVKQCIMAQTNTIDPSDSYYCSIVDSYLASYRYTTLQYDNKIYEYQMQIDAYDDQIEMAEQNASSASLDVDSLKTQRDGLISSKESIENEKIQALSNLELQQITAIEQQISGYNDTILSMETNLISAELQLELVDSADNETKETIAILTEKGNVAAEILSCQDSIEECENYLKSYDIQNDNCTVRASVSGYYYATQNLKTGTYVQEGAALGTIYPEQESKYYAEIYVKNADIAKIEEGQEVKFEIASYPSSEYGYVTGVVENIAKDISIDENTGCTYYLVKVRCDYMTIRNENGEEISLINGMACQAKFVVDEQNVLTYFLEKIDLLD